MGNRKGVDTVSDRAIGESSDQPRAQALPLPTILDDDSRLANSRISPYDSSRPLISGIYSCLKRCLNPLATPGLGVLAGAVCHGIGREHHDAGQAGLLVAIFHRGQRRLGTMLFAPVKAIAPVGLEGNQVVIRTGLATPQTGVRRESRNAMFEVKRPIISVAVIISVALSGVLGLAGARPVAGAFPFANVLIAFQSNRDHFDNPAQFEIYVMNADGSAQTRITFVGGATPAWSPDGRKIVFSRNGGSGGEIWVMSADGSNQTRLTTAPPANDITPAWSSDGSKIVFARVGGSNYDIWVMNADGSAQTDITNSPAEDIDPSWQPNGSRIAFRTNRGGTPQIYTMNSDGSGLTNLSNSPTSFDDTPDWSPNGSWIAFASNRATPGFGVDIYVMKADGSGVSRLTTTGQDEMPAWAPDGSKIAFKSFRDLNDEIYVMNADGTGATRLTNNALPGNTLPEDWFPSWQPIKPLDTTPPVLSVPAPIVTDATGPAGAFVSYVVTATDPDDVASAPVCTPSSGAIFPIGSTTVQCTSTDTHRNIGSASFTVHVKGAREQLSDLLAHATGIGSGTSLADKVTQVQTDLASNAPADACSTLTAFVNEVQAQSGKKISPIQAAALVVNALQIA